MIEEKVNGKGLAVPLLVGGLIGGGIAFLMSPFLVRARASMVAAADKAKVLIRGKKGVPPESGIYCEVPEGADICFEEEKSK